MHKTITSIAFSICLSAAYSQEYTIINNTLHKDGEIYTGNRSNYFEDGQVKESIYFIVIL